MLSQLLITVPVWQYSLSQVFGAVQVIIMIIAMQVKDKTKTLWLYALGNVFAIISNAFLLNFIVIGVKSVSLVKNPTFAWMEKKRDTLKTAVRVAILLFFCALATVIVIFIPRDSLFDWVIFGTLIFSYFGEWRKGIHLIRIGLAVYTVTLVINAVMFFNIAGIIANAIVLIAIAVFYIRLAANRKKHPATELLPSAQLETNAELSQPAQLETNEKE